jgi:hypothetical protein
MFYEEFLPIVDRVAELLPEPPPLSDLGGYGRWEALTLDAGRRLAALADADTALLRGLLDGDYRALAGPAAPGPRRTLLLRVALCAALQAQRSQPQPDLRRLRLSGGTAVEHTQEAGSAGLVSRRPGLNAG